MKISFGLLKGVCVREREQKRRAGLNQEPPSVNVLKLFYFLKKAHQGPSEFSTNKLLSFQSSNKFLTVFNCFLLFKIHGRYKFLFLDV